jgi:hypothetical protein
VAGRRRGMRRNTRFLRLERPFDLTHRLSYRSQPIGASLRPLGSRSRRSIAGSIEPGK